MEYRDDKYYLEILVLAPSQTIQDGMLLSCSVPFKYWDETYKDWKRKPWQDNFLENAKHELLGNPSEFLCVYHHDVAYHIKCYLLDRSKRWWNKVIRTVDAKGVYHIKCNLPILSKHSDLRDCEVIAYITNYVLPEDLFPSNV